MTVKVTGVDRMMQEIQSRMDRISGPQAEKAINSGGKIVHQNIKNAMGSFRDTGASQDETSFTMDTRRGQVKGHVFWQGPRNRYRLIHLNEHGYNRNGRKHRPRGFGTIARALSRSETVYFRMVRRELSR